MGDFEKQLASPHCNTAADVLTASRVLRGFLQLRCDDDTAAFFLFSIATTLTQQHPAPPFCDLCVSKADDGMRCFP